MKKGYLQQKAASWVSVTVLAGGLLTAVILAFVVHTEKSFSTWTPSTTFEDLY